ncbi:TYK2 isoform 17, partial [Pongo abelii]
SFRTILRDLTRLQPHNLADVLTVNPDSPASDPTVFHKRYLKKIRDLGEGHFGKVSLYCYDPTNDGTGEMVAVKALKADCAPQHRSGWKQEIDILRTLYHEHIVKYKGCCEDQGLSFHEELLGDRGVLPPNLREPHTHPEDSP